MTDVRELLHRVRPWLGAPTVEAAGRFFAGGYGAASFLFFVSAPSATLDRAVLRNALYDAEQRRLVVFLALGVALAAVWGGRAARAGRDALVAASYEAFLAAPLALWPLYEAAPFEHVRLISAAALAGFAGFALHRFAAHSPRGAILDRLDAPGVARIGFAVALALGLVHGAAMAWVALSMNKGALAAVQSVALGLGALPLYAVAMRMTRQTAVALLVTASYLLHPCVPGIGEDVHVVPFAPVMLALAWAVIAERTRLAAALFVVALASRADAGLYVAVFALYLLLEAEPPRLARWMFGIAAACFVATLLVSSSSVEPRFANPLSAIDEIVSSGERWQFVVLVLLPVALLPLVTSRGALLVAPGLGACLVGASDRWSIEHAYAAPLLPFLFLGTVLGIARIRQSRTRTVLAIVVLVATALVTSKFAREPVLNGPRVRRDLTAASTRPQ